MLSTWQGSLALHALLLAPGVTARPAIWLTENADGDLVAPIAASFASIATSLPPSSSTTAVYQPSTVVAAVSTFAALPLSSILTSQAASSPVSSAVSSAATSGFYTSSGSAAASSVASSAASSVATGPSSSSNPFPNGQPASSYWLADDSMHNQILPIYGQSASTYKLFRNVKTDYGAVGDGSTDDTAAINRAFSDGNRCGQGCNSSTTSPAIVYFPPGQYVVSTPIQMDYYTQMIGDALDLPSIVGSADFKGMALIDADPYDSNGANWFINQNNFFRQVRNFNVDMTRMGDAGAGIHWQVAQATSLQNINFKMNSGASNKQIGIFMDNGSGGFMSDLTFSGGNYGAFFGSQQFTARNLAFSDCNTAIFMNWNWGWTFHNVTINGCGTGIDVSTNPTNQTVGSMVLADSHISGVTYGIVSAYSLNGNVPAAGGTLIIENTNIVASGGAIVTPQKAVIVPSGQITTWASGNGYDNSGTGAPYQKTIAATSRPASLLDSNSNIFTRSKPQYELVPSSDFLSAKAFGCHGDGQTDDTQCLQNFIDTASQQGKIAYFDYGAYIVTDTVTISSSLRMVGECWSMIVARGFSDQSNPKAVIQVGKPDGSTSGAVEIVDMLFEIDGPNPGAIMIEWNINSSQGESGMWDSHVRMGGSYGSDLLLSECAKDPSQTTANPNCEGGFLMFHATKSAGNVYLENTWFWTADHDMEDPLNRQISIYNGRGVLIQAQGPVWLWGTASEHSILYNYQLDGAQAVFGGFMQSETPYMQPNPLAPNPFTFMASYDDPDFASCTSGSQAVPCQDAWGMRVVNSQNVLVYSAGMYSFFNNYDQACVSQQNCQQSMIRIENSSVSLYAVSTKAAVNMISDANRGAVTTVLDADNRSNFCATVAFYLSSP